MKIAFLFALAVTGLSVAAEARPLDTRSMTCEQVRSVVGSSGVRGVDMYTQFGYSNVFAPRVRGCHFTEVAEGAFVRTKDMSGSRRCAAGWTCVYDRNRDR